MPGLPARRLDLRTDSVDAVGDRHQGDAGARRRVGGAELLEPAVVGARARPREARVGDHAGLQAGAERRRLHAGDRVAVGEDHLAGDAVVRRATLSRMAGSIGAAEADLVVAFPRARRTRR